MDLFAEIQGASREPELLPQRQRRAVQAMAREILSWRWSLEHEIDPLFKLVCREFEKCPRADWAGQIRAFHKEMSGKVRQEAKSEPFRVVYPALEPEPEQDTRWSILDRAYAPFNIAVSLESGMEVSFVWALDRDIRWRWRGTWHAVTKARFCNLTPHRWGSALEEWDVKRVNWDEIERSRTMRWMPLATFNRDSGGGKFADISIVERFIT